MFNVIMQLNVIHLQIHLYLFRYTCHKQIKSSQWIRQTLDTNPCDKMWCQIACYWNERLPRTNLPVLKWHIQYVLEVKTGFIKFQEYFSGYL